LSPPKTDDQIMIYPLDIYSAKSISSNQQK